MIRSDRREKEREKYAVRTFNIQGRFCTICARARCEWREADGRSVNMAMLVLNVLSVQLTRSRDCLERGFLLITTFSPSLFSTLFTIRGCPVSTGLECFLFIFLLHTHIYKYASRFRHTWKLFYYLKWRVPRDIFLYAFTMFGPFTQCPWNSSTMSLSLSFPILLFPLFFFFVFFLSRRRSGRRRLSVCVGLCNLVKVIASL